MESNKNRKENVLIDEFICVVKCTNLQKFPSVAALFY